MIVTMIILRVIMEMTKNSNDEAILCTKRNAYF